MSVRTIELKEDDGSPLKTPMDLMVFTFAWTDLSTAPLVPHVRDIRRLRSFVVRHEALIVRMEVEDLRLLAVVAVG